MSILGAFFRRSGKQYEAPSNTPDPVAHRYVEHKVTERRDHWGTSQRPHLIGYDPGVPATAMITTMPPMAIDPDKPQPPGMMEWEQVGFSVFNVGEPRNGAGKLSGITV